MAPSLDRLVCEHLSVFGSSQLLLVPLQAETRVDALAQDTSGNRATVQ